LRTLLPLMLALCCVRAGADVPGLDGGHVKGRWLGTDYPDDSVFNAALGSSAQDQGAELRLKFDAGRGRWGIKADYQLLAQFGDSLDLPRDAQGLFLVPGPLPDDQRRWWDLTDTISDNDDRLVAQRLDRLHLDYTGNKTVVRFGRQAVTWGNGLIYTPMDFFNPFDPAAVDTEYKVGDDMLYAQYLLDSGDDWQFVSVQRRDDDDDVSSEVSSTALKYHGFGADREFDLLLAEHFDQFILGAGGLVNIGESVLRGDITFTDAEDSWETSLVTSWSYSWVWGGRNVSAVAEYFYNGFGLRESDYTEKLREDTDLVQRLVRGELFTLGRHYVAGSLLVEWTPLLNLTPNLFVNLGDESVLAQLVAQWDLAQNWQLLGALTAPFGSKGTEYGGLETGVDDLTLEVGPSLFIQLAWYF
jgi:hypothetical protein